MKSKRRYILLALLIFAIFITYAALYDGLIVRHYTLKTDKLKSPVRFVLVTDLHSVYFGEDQRELIEKIRAQDPDAILFAGDIADDHNSNDGTVSLLNGIATEYPSYYVSGNHEIWSNQIGKIKSIFAMRGIKILEGDVTTAEFNGQTINICGVDDPEIGEEAFQRQLQNTSHFNDQNYTILLSHRPERMEEYAKNGYDLVLSGHTHGGQWRIPLISNGLYAPSQGNFPKYSGGKYVMGGTTMIVGRGLQKNIGKYRRIFNPSELVVIDIEPK